MAESTLTVVFEAVEDGWVQARIAEVPAVITVGRDRAEARSMVEDALREYLLAVGESEPNFGEGDREKVSLILRPAG